MLDDHKLDDSAAQFKGIENIRWDIIGAGSGHVILMVCGKHENSLPINRLPSIATLTVSGRCLGNPGSIHVRNHAAVTIRRPNTNIEYISLSSETGDALQIQAGRVTVKDVSATNSKNGIVLTALDEVDDVTISDNQVENNELVGIKLHEKSPGKVYKQITIARNTVTGNGNHGIRIWFRPEATRSSYITNLTIMENNVISNKADGIVVVHQGANYESPNPLLSDVTISNNHVERNKGGIAARGIRTSRFYESSQISNNVIRYNTGSTGGVNLFWSRGILIESNNICCNRTGDIDGNGILIDHGNRDIHIKRNLIEKNSGNRVVNSGVGVMVLDNENILVENNVIKSNWVGIFLGGKNPSKNITIRGNTIEKSVRTDIYKERWYDESQVKFEKNIQIDKTD